jgi:hypothetical protein
LKLVKNSEIESCQVYKYLGFIFDTSGTKDKGIRSRVIKARKCIACLNGILWSEDIRKARKLKIYNALIKSSLLCGSETWRLTKNNKRRVEATEMDALRRSSRISRKERIRNVTIRQQIGLEETIVKEIEQNQFDTVRSRSENGRRKITQNSIEVGAETKESTRKTEEKLVGMYKESHE